MHPRVVILGAGGGVGSSVAFNLLLRPEPYDVELVDGRSGMAVSHEMDLQQVLASGARGSVRIVGLQDIAAADVIVLSASAPLTVNRSRMVYLQQNAEIVQTVLAPVLRSGWPGVLIVVTNPVDPLCTWIHRHSDLDRRRILGYTANDSLRLRTAVGGALGVPARGVDAWVLGEHGDGCVPLLDRISVDGAPVTLDPAQRSEVEEFVRGWYIRHVALDSNRSSTWTSGLGVARMVEAVLHPRDELWPASIVLNGEYGIDGVALSVPVRLGTGGLDGIETWDLDEDEGAAMHAAAAAVATAVDALDVH